MPEHPQIGLELFWQEAFKVLERIRQTQADAIRHAALLFADCIEKNGVIQAYSTGHSRVLTMELAGRAGGLVPVNRIDLEDLALYAHWPLERVRKSAIERDLEAGQAILACYRIEPQDVFIIASNSGVNAAIVEVAQRTKEHGHSLVTVTSREHTRRTESRHPSGKKLYEFADVVIDNCGPFGDALLELPQGGKACSISSLSGALIDQMLTAETICNLITRGINPPIFISANIPGGIEQGERLRQHYKGRIN
ncbi:MAG: sugar isomerase domain-containing protein [Ktedonobacteraceae bacterium]